MSRNYDQNTSDVQKEDDYGGLNAMLSTVQRAGRAQQAVNQIAQNYADDKPLHCYYCGKPAEEVVPSDWSDPDVWGVKYDTASDWVRGEEGTFNPERWTFCCDSCYIHLGTPSGPRGSRWRAGDPIN